MALRELGNIMAATLYYGHYSGWTRSKQAAISAACKGSRDDMGGVEEEITAHRLTGPVTLASLIRAMNDMNALDIEDCGIVAVVKNGRRIKGFLDGPEGLAKTHARLAEGRLPRRGQGRA